MNEMNQFMSQFSESEVISAYARAAEALNDLQQQRKQQLPLAEQQQQQQQHQHQQQQQQQSKIPPTVMQFLQTVLQRAQERSTDSSGLSDPMQYIRTDAGKGLLWEVLKGKGVSSSVPECCQYGQQWHMRDPMQMPARACCGRCFKVRHSKG
jgi:hypothetical protein